MNEITFEELADLIAVSSTVSVVKNGQIIFIGRILKALEELDSEILQAEVMTIRAEKKSHIFIDLID